ncbi:MAG TPA: EAL domain-containing protein, partial [Steroidobacteraceae bacterium]|nr:EAL domain-containing protein [Steroidobacteraceae bacterium]
PALLGRQDAAIPPTTRAWIELIHPFDRERFRLAAIRAARSGQRSQIEYRLCDGGGKWIHLHATMEPLDSEPGRGGERRWICTLQDVSAARRAEQAVRASEPHYRLTLEQAAGGIAHTSLAGDLHFANQTFCDMTGYGADELLKLHIRDLTHPEDIGASLEGRAQCIEHGAPPYRRELRLRRKDGAWLWADVTTCLVRGADAQPLHFVTVLSDVSERKRAEQEVDRFRAAMDASADAIFIAEPGTMRLLYVNETACLRLGLSREELLETPVYQLLGRTREQLAREHEDIIAAGSRGTRTETRYRRGDGARGWTELHRKALATEDGAVIVTVARDVTERKAQQAKIERLSRMHAMLSGINAAIVRMRDREQLFRECCRIAHEAGGFDAVWIGLVDPQQSILQAVACHGQDERVGPLLAGCFALGSGADGGLLGEMLRERRPAVSNDAPRDARGGIPGVTSGDGIRSAALLPLTAGDSVMGVMALYSPVGGHFDAAEVKLLSQLAADISFALESLAKSERATYLALYDELTGLPNRRLFAERLAQCMRAAGQAQGRLALVLMDIERLRAVNKSLGWRAGDAVLRMVGTRLTAAVGAAAAGRIDSNYFALVLPSVRDAGDAERQLSGVARSCFAEPFVVEGTELRMGAKAGLALFPNDGVDAETLLVNAESALRRAKATGERNFFYAPDDSERTGSWLRLENELGRALERGEFTLHYQPKVDTVTRCVAGVEALIRWQSPELGLVPPAQFIPLTEQTGMILEVGAWALERAALDQRRWAEQGFEALRVAVNVSAIQLRQRDFVRTVEQAIRAGAGPCSIDLEITESLVMDDVKENIRRLEELRALGVEIAIDDFGTGYSSLAYLTKLPVAGIKIDRSFVSAMLTDPASMTLVQTIISLSHTLGRKVIAEGVEQEEQARYLRLLRCDQMQGYLVSRPLPYEELMGFLAQSGVPAAAAGPRT